MLKPGVKVLGSFCCFSFLFFFGFISPLKSQGSRIKFFEKRVLRIGGSAAFVAQVFQPAGSRDFPVPCSKRTGGWKAARTRRAASAKATVRRGKNVCATF